MSEDDHNAKLQSRQEELRQAQTQQRAYANSQNVAGIAPQADTLQGLREEMRRRGQAAFRHAQHGQIRQRPEYIGYPPDHPLFGIEFDPREPEEKAAERPAFEVRTDRHHFKVYASGKIEGFPLDEGGVCIINRIPQLLA